MSCVFTLIWLETQPYSSPRWKDPPRLHLSRYHDNLIPIPFALFTLMQTFRNWCRLCNCQIYIRAEVYCFCTLQLRSRSRTVFNPLRIRAPTVQGYGFGWTWSRQRLAGGWLRYVHNTVSCHHCGAQHSVTEGGSSSRSNDVPANLLNYPNDPSLTGSSSHGSRPQGSGSTISFHTHDHSPVSYGKPPEYPWSAP